MACNIVVEWLRSLQLQQYADSFLDNGYDDLEICKQVGDPDLDAIGVLNPQHRLVLLQSVRSLREEGAASVYFTLEPKEEEEEEEPATPSDAASPVSPAPGGDRTYADEYEEGKAELVRIPKMQLKLLLREKLAQDGVGLSFQPYSTSEGERGYLEGLASRYADRFNTHYQDVLEHLEELRRQEWDDLSPKMRRVVTSTVSTPGTPPFPGPLLLDSQSGGGGLYAPGKYSTSGVQPSSCLNDKEEDEIYGFGYGVYGRQMLHRQQQMAQTAAPIYQSCLSPRSAYFYEFPPGDQASTSKKKTTFSRLLRTLRPHRKDKHNSSVSPTANWQQPKPILQQCNASAHPVNASSRVSTPDDPVPPDYEHIRLMTMNSRGQPVCGSVSPGGFEETIQRLKMQDAIKKKERFHKEQEEILRDIRHGLMQIGLDATPSTASIPHYPSVSDDTYMYDDEIHQQQQQQQQLQKRPTRPLHWYDEPPYESDPEDFLMGGLAANRAVFQNGRVCFTLNLKQEPRGEGVISLRSAGDISIPKEASWRRGARPKRNHHRESGDYAASDAHSVGSRLSTISVETNRSAELDAKVLALKTRSHSSEEAQSPSCLSDTEEGGKVSRSMRHDKKRLRAEATDKENRSVNGEHQRQHQRGKQTVEYPPSIGKARALVDCIPSPYDKESLRFKKGDIIDIISMNVSGNWKGYVHGKIGTFKFINVELISAAPGSIGPISSSVPRKGAYSGGRTHKRNKPRSLEELLHRVNLEAYASIFVMNGYEDLEVFKELEEADLEFLGFRNPELKAKVLAAIRILMDYDSPSESGDEASSSDSSARLSQSGKVPFKRLDLGRDSGCYASSNEHSAAGAAAPVSEKATPEPEKRTLIEAPRSANASPRLRSASAAVASALAAASMAAAQSKEAQQTVPATGVPRTPSYDFRAEYDKLKGKLEASLTKLPLAADGQRPPESAVAAGIRCFSEKSSDSGVSSSSRSPPPVVPQAASSPSTTKPDKPPPLA